MGVEEERRGLARCSEAIQLNARRWGAERRGTYAFKAGISADAEKLRCWYL